MYPDETMAPTRLQRGPVFVGQRAGCFGRTELGFTPLQKESHTKFLRLLLQDKPQALIHQLSISKAQASCHWCQQQRIPNFRLKSNNELKSYMRVGAVRDTNVHESYE